MYAQIIDANVNRISEGLRVIEEYVRFVSNNSLFSQKIAKLRQSIHQLFPQLPEHLLIRDIQKDARAKQSPKKRCVIITILTRYRKQW